MWLTDAQKIGVGLTSFGAVFMLLGVVMLFDGPLIALGNILFVSGLPLIIGPRKTFYFFARRNKLRGSFAFLAGIVLVFLKYPFFGVLIETFGFLNLFGYVCLSVSGKGTSRDCSEVIAHAYEPLQTLRSNSDFFPVVLSFMRQLPVIGSFLSMPGVRQVTDRICGVRQSPV
ncbi:SPOSA6832_02566 [Sporobolomyces salmonicolor]|uniref:SPOSA6832_02566-mRNA-1:cds n=1 Tax=Sporidiobolus salmonicolor TaxID=5005 RepID=A0A0D6ELU9_SPOSA|nr:SPOSA6832_02566 [Sporobolomyces salmonicolor]